MNRTVLNLTVDFVATLLFLSMIATGYLLRFPLPPGSNKSLSLWGLSRHQWGDLHFWISAALLLVMLIHLALHWNWIVSTIGKRCSLIHNQQASLVRSAIWSIVVLILLCLGFAWLVETQLQSKPQINRGHRMRVTPNTYPQLHRQTDEIINRIRAC